MRVEKSELGIALVKGGLGAIPLVGPLVAEVVGALIPNRRLERLEELMAELSRQIGDRDSESLRERFTSPEFVDILEEAMQQAARAVDPTRILQVAALLKNGLTDDEFRHLQDKRLLELLGELNDAEVILLRSYTYAVRNDAEWRKQHEAVLRPPLANMGAPQDDMDQATLHGQFREHLARLGLLKQRFRRWKKGELPEFNERTGLPQTEGYELTSLGRLLLRRIDVLGPDER